MLSGLHKKQKLERIIEKQNEEGDLWRRSSRSAGNMGKKNMDISKSRTQIFFKIGVLRNFAKFTGKHLFQSIFFNKVADPRSELRQRCFPVNFAKFLRTLFFYRTTTVTNARTWKVVVNNEQNGKVKKHKSFILCFTLF